MKKLIENMKNIFGDRGVEWIRTLPNTVDKLCAYWNLTQAFPVDNMTFNYVAKALSHSKQAVVLKIGCDAKSIFEEKEALLYFNGEASIKLLEYNEEFHAMLLEQAIPGISLKSFYPDQTEFVIDCYVDVIQKLHNKNIPQKNSYQHISDWLKAIDKLSANQLPNNMLHQVIHLKNNLLNTLGKNIFLHGDLHHDNVIKNNNQWLAIDPKGIVGEAEFEVAAFDFIHESEKNKSEVKKLFESRVAFIAKKSNLNFQRIKDWVFVRLILSAAWSLEDNVDASWAIKLAENII